MYRTLSTAVAFLFVTVAPLAAWPDGGWRRTDTERCRVHWSDATPWAAARVLAACDDTVARAVDEGVLDVVLDDRGGLASARDGVAYVPASPGDDRAVGGDPTLQAALARAVGQAAVQRQDLGVRMEVSLLAGGAPTPLTAGGVATIGDVRRPAWRAVGEAGLRTERAGGARWTSVRDMQLRVAVLRGVLLRSPDLAMADGPSPLHRRLVAVQGYSFSRFLAERFDPDPWSGAEPEALFADWVARAEAVYADQVDAIGEEACGAPPSPDDLGGAWAIAGPDLDRLRLSADGRWLAWTDGAEAVVTERWAGPERAPRIARRAAPGGLDWAPDSGRVVVSDGQLYVWDVVSGVERRLTEGLAPIDPAWSPGGDSVAFVHRRDGRSRLGLLNPERPEDGITWILAPMDGAWIGRPDWSADGRWLVFEMYRGGRWDLWAVGRGGGDLRPLTWDGARERDPVIDPRGRAVWFSSDATGVFDIRRLDLLTGQVERITRVHGGALSPAVSADGSLLYLHYGRRGFETRRMVDPPALDRSPSPRPSTLEVARSLLPEQDGTPGVDDAAAGWSVLPITLLPQAVWDEALSAGLRVGVAAPAGPTLSAGLLLGTASAAHLEIDSGGPIAVFTAARWLAISRPLAVAADLEGDPNTVGHAVAVEADGDSDWIAARAGVRAQLASGVALEGFGDLLHVAGDARVAGVGAPNVLRAGLAAALVFGGPRDPRGRLRLEHGLFVTDLAAPTWDSAEVIGRGEATGGSYDYAYQRVLLDGAARLPAGWLSAAGRRLELRLRGGWISRNVSPEEEMFAGLVHPADRLRPDRAGFGLGGYDEFAVHGETLLLAGLGWRVPLGASWRWTAGPMSMSGGWAELFADAGNAWGHSARWQRTSGGALVTDAAGRPVAVPGTVRRDNPLQHDGAQGPRLLTEVGVELGLRLNLFHAPWGSTLRAAYGFQAVRGRGDTDGDGVVAWTDPGDPLGSEAAPAGLRIALALGTGLP